MPPPSPSHKHKKQFQPSITNFFPPFSSTHPSEQDPSVFTSSPPKQWPAPRPLAPLPAHVQSSLLNVGMRIRKAVPEGYKTHSAASIQKPSFGSSYPAQSMPLTQRARPRELIPYCAINSVGNLDVEKDMDEAGLRDADLPDLLFPGEEDDWDTPFSCQESGTSTTSGLGISGVATLPSNMVSGRKRVWEDPEDEDQAPGDMGLKPSDFSGQLLSSDSITQASTATIQLRPLAQPRSKRKSVASMGQGAAGGIKVPEKPMGRPASGDFEEADFFREEDWLGEEMEF